MYQFIKKLFAKKYIKVPITPPPGLLESMALRYDHSFGLPTIEDELGVSGYLDWKEIDEYRKKNLFTSHQSRRYKEGVLTIMRQLHEEVVGTGFYKYNE